MHDFKLGDKIVCNEIFKQNWQNFTVGKVYTIIPGDRLCPLTIVDDLGYKLEPNWYQFTSLSKIRKNKLKKIQTL